MKKIIMLMAIASLSFAAPAYHGEIEFKQKNSSKFSGHLKGDEYFSWVEDKQGNIIMYNKQSKNYEYAKVQIVNGYVEVIPSGAAVGDFSNNSSPLVQSSSEQIDKNILYKIWKRKRKDIKIKSH